MTRHLHVVQAYARFDVAMAGAVATMRDRGHTVPCREGCVACCDDVTLVHEEELGPMVERIRRWHPRKQALLLDALLDWDKRVRSAGIDPAMVIDDSEDAASRRARYYGAHATCPMLDQERGRCMVYEERPVTCRGHYVVDEPPSRCAEVATNPVTSQLTAVEPLIEVVLTIYGRQPTWQLLPYVLRRMLEAEETST